MKNFIKSVLVTLSFVSTLNTNAQVPVYSSLPTATAVVFLDFDGHTVNGTAWNYAGPIYCNASGFTTDQMTTAFNRVAEDYRPFNVNVTTDSTKFLAAPANRRMRVILTTSWEWYGSAGGVAFVGSFTWGDDTPCFVFTSLLNYNVKNISEAASHEAGHTLNLQHQSVYNASCVKTAEYNAGIGTGEIGWAPIMGVGYYKNLTLWNSGQSSQGCNSIQNDLSVITTGNGFNFRTDDYASTFNGATNAPFLGNQFIVNGIIGQNTDQDMIKFTQSAYGRFLMSAVPYNVGTGNAGSNLDLQVTLFNGSQTQLNVYNPGTLLSSVIDTMLTPGTYYIRIEGKGNIYAPNYASLGSYALQGDWSNSTLPLRTLKLHGVLNGDKHQLSWIIDADELVTEQILEISTDGRNFNPVIQPDIITRSYIYRPNISSTAQYRMNVTFDNGKQYYSNIVTLRKTGATAAPKLINNLITSTSFEVSSPGVYNYVVYDLNGKTMTQGKLANGSNIITSDNIKNGMYFIRFTNGTEQWIDKFVKQ